jgi:alkylation response protein AidB-like acyl-CoA dehydrogenase
VKTEALEARLNQIEKLRQPILDAGDEAQEMRRLPEGIVERLIQDGFFRFALPSALGGEDASAVETIIILEAMAAIDASVAWNVMLGSEINAMAAGGMEEGLAKQIYLEHPEVIMCGGGGPGSSTPRAERQDDGSVRVWAQATFISGCHNADWCFLAAPLMRGDEIEHNANGQPIFKLWMLARDQWEIIDTWHVAGLRGSGSNDVKTEGGVVRPEHVDVDLVEIPPKHDNPVFRIPVPLRLSYNKVAIALGVAKGALETFSDLAQNKIPLMSTSSLAHRPIAQYRMGEAMAEYRSARAFVLQAMGAVEDELRAGAPYPGAKTTQDARLACVHGANACMKVVDLLHNTAGTTGMRMHSPLERKLRDAHGCATHRWVSHPLYQDLGSILLGNDSAPEFAGGLAGPMPR